MKWIVSALIVLAILSGNRSPATAAGQGEDAAVVRQDVEALLDLWRDGRYEEVYRRTVESGGHSKEYFVSHLAAAPRRPACCWEKLQEVRVTVDGASRATLKARFGLETGTGTEFITKSIKLRRDDGVWKVAMSDLLSLSGKGRRVHGGRKSP